MSLVDIEPTEIFVRHYDELKKSVNARDDYERLSSAAILRQLLIDGFIHQVNRNLRIKLRFRVNNVGDINDIPVMPDIVFHGHGLDPTKFQIKAGIKELSLSQFLSVPIWEMSSEIVTVRDVIKLAANKAGGVHFDLSRTPEEARQEQAIKRISDLGVHSLAIALETIISITLVALRPLRDALVRLPNSLKLFAHYRLEEGAIEFDGKQQFLETNLNHELKDGWGWHGVLRIMSQAEDGERVIYQIGNLDGSPPLYTLKFVDNDSLVATAKIDDTTTLLVKTEGIRKSILFDHFAYYAFEVRYEVQKVEAQLYVNNVPTATAQSSTISQPKCVTRQTIGADLLGKHPATFQIRELVIADMHVDAKMRKLIAKYLWMQWHD